MTTTRALQALLLGTALTVGGCGGEVTSGDDQPSPEGEGGVRGEESTYLKWWNSSITYIHVVLGWYDTDLSVASSTPIQLRHASRLLRHGVYGWGYMPEFEDTVTGHHFRFLHLRPQHQYATDN